MKLRIVKHKPVKFTVPQGDLIARFMARQGQPLSARARRRLEEHKHRRK